MVERRRLRDWRGPVTPLNAPTLAAVCADLEQGRVTSVALVEDSLRRIADQSGEGPRSFIRVFADTALAAARAADLLRAARVPLPTLAGVPIAVKDLFDVAGSVTTAGSLVLAQTKAATRDAPVVARLRAAGAVVIGTTNMTEFAMGGLGINPHYGTPRNPYDRATGRLPGGSSSGSAVAVADGIVAGAIGSDTAGSVQMPAAFCGLVGFKPTARRVPLAGAIPLAASLDSIGPLARSVACCITLDAILSAQPSAAVPATGVRGLRFAVPQTLVLDGLEPDVARAFDHALSALAEAGAMIVDIPFRELAEIAELGARGTFSVIEGYAWHREHLARDAAGYDPIVARRFAAGADVRASDYIALCNGRRDLIERARIVTRPYDALLMPTVPLVAPPMADYRGNEERWLATNRLMTRNPGVANFLDRCAITLPCHSDGDPPVGISAMGETLGDDRLLQLARAVEHALKRS